MGHSVYIWHSITHLTHLVQYYLPG